MELRKLVCRALLVPIILSVCSSTIFGQDEVHEISCSPIDVAMLPPAIAPEFRPRTIRTISFQPLLLAAIDERLGARYRWGAEGPNSFDCSGFVWSIFQATGINFERGSARTLFARFSPALEEEEFKFGTLVFFSGLTHVGVVADEHGFYHASRRHGVIYSPFNEYWLKRIDGFRRIPLPAQLTD